jgi:ADP-ribose pyrophosphatase YjhB (NUDIX family)
MMKNLIRPLFSLIFPFLKIYWSIFQPESLGSAVIIQFEGEILLVRNSYGSLRWALPGGFAKSNETPEKTARREVYEEVGVRLDNLSKVGSFRRNFYGRKDTVWVFKSWVTTKNTKSESFEIQETSWVKINSLPGNLSPYTKEALKLSNLV